MDGIDRVIHMLGKPARRAIIELYLTRYSSSELSQFLGVSKAAITKYVKGETHPSDSVLKKMLDIDDKELKKKIINIIVEELITAFAELARLSSREIGEDYTEHLEQVICKRFCE